MNSTTTTTTTRIRFVDFPKTIVTGLLALAGTTGCNVTDPGPFDPVRFQENHRARASEVQNRPMAPLPTTLESPFLPPANNSTTRPAATRPTTQELWEDARRKLEPGETVVRMSLQEIQQRAAANNGDVRVAGYEPAIEETRVVENEARFDPRVFANIQYSDNQSATAGFDPNSFSSTFETEQEALTGAAGVRQLLDYGTELEISYQSSRVTSDPDQAIDPYYENDLVLEITQPLLRDFGREVNRARIVVSRNNQRISMLDWRRQIEETSLEVEETYWDLVQAERDVQILEELLKRTIETADILYKRRGQDVTRVQLSQADSTLKRRQSLLVGSRAQVRNLSDRLKRLMNDPDMPVTSSVLVMPGVAPLEQPVRFELTDQIDTALEHRAELGQQQIRIDSATIASRVAKNSLLPQLNFVGSAGLQGLDDDWGTAAGDQGDFENPSYAIGFEFEIPIGNRAARAAYQRSLLQRQQAIDQYSHLVNVISEQVKTSMRDVYTTWEQMERTRAARFSAADALKAIEQREAANEPLTPEFVQLKLDRQAELAQVQQAEAETISEYNASIARLEAAKGTLLRYNNIIMAEDPVGTKRW